MKQLDVKQSVHQRNGQLVEEPKLDARGKAVLVKGDSKWLSKLTDDDELQYEALTVGKLLCHALEQPDEKMSPEERRKRFFLSVKIEDALQSGHLFEFEPDDEKRIHAAADLITNNHLFLGRIYEAMEMAEVVKKQLKAVE